MTDELNTNAGAGPVEQGVRPRAWAIFVDGGNARMWSMLQPHVQKLADAEGLAVTPLYDQPAIDAAVAAERKHWRTLLSRQHVFNGSCPDAENWHDRDPECPACRALGEWRA